MEPTCQLYSQGLGLACELYWGWACELYWGLACELYWGWACELYWGWACELYWGWPVSSTGGGPVTSTGGGAVATGMKRRTLCVCQPDGRQVWPTTDLYVVYYKSHTHHLCRAELVVPVPL